MTQDKDDTALSKTIDLVEKTGLFLNEITGGGMQELGQSFHDWASYVRMKNLIAIQDKVDALRKSRKIEGKPTPIPPRLAIPLIQEASIEDAEEIQAIWARLICKATDNDSSKDIHPAFIEIIKQLNSDEAMILNAFRKIPEYPLLFKAKSNMSTEIFEISLETVKGLASKYIQELNLSDSLINSYIDNLTRLKIIDIRFDEFLGLTEKPFVAFYSDDELRPTASPHERIQLNKTRNTYLYVTDFGKAFINICIDYD
jgi:hypothetical protein